MTPSGSIENSTVEDYIYDYDESLSYLPLEELIPVTIIYIITLLLGLLGNSLVIVSVARFKKMQNVTNIFLLSLASADLLLVLICVPVKCAAFFSYTWKFGTILCKLVNYLQNVSIMCSVMNLTGLSLERYYAIIHPMRAKYVCTLALTKKSVVLIWLMSFVLASPTLVGQVHKLVGTYREAFWCVLEWDNIIIQKVYGIYMYLVILIIPFALITFAYVSICWRLWLMDCERNGIIMSSNNEMSSSEMSVFRGRPFQNNEVVTNNKNSYLTVPLRPKSTSHENKTRKQVVKMLVAIVLLFLLCWGPIMTNNLLVAFNILDNLHMGHLKYLRQALHVLSYCNSCINPVVYGFMSNNFRKAFLDTLRILCGNNQRNINVGGSVVRYSFHCGTRSISTNLTPTIQKSY